MSGLPSVGVVIPTRDRPELVRQAVDAVRAQSYRGRVEVLVVHDGVPPDHRLEVDDDRPVRVVANTRTPGLAGARNTGITALRTEFVAFCDDDDVWRPDKLAVQVERACRSDAPELVTCAMTVDFDGVRTDRVAGTEQVTHADLARHIMATLHSSSMLFRRRALVEDIALVSEEIPGSQNEDWDLKLRTAARGPIAHVDQPLVVVRWGSASQFARRWDSKAASLEWMLAHHPAIAADRRGAARVHGQLAFYRAADGERRAALGWALRAVRRDPLQWRALLALPVAARLVGAGRLLDLAHRFGRGI